MIRLYKVVDALLLLNTVDPFTLEYLFIEYGKFDIGWLYDHGFIELYLEDCSVMVRLTDYGMDIMNRLNEYIIDALGFEF